ncbi:MAG: MBL fold metallo-hydrolase [Saprospiraceae bacterium]|uniref:MBL fold metallo-hydrolase n=1 Tax=Candidatus Opimibacter skivensis TaxID=2982028 RepID=A0A9D7XQU6_9BACT|nr:MBL fold metallo-hydrolase [Candidatus Opimibacter skivensis]
MSLSVHALTFNPFEENTYIIYSESGDCIIIDPGCFDDTERSELIDFVKENNLKPVRLINTHCHIDHILGNAFVASEYSIGLEIHEGELPVLKAGMAVAGMYGVPYNPSPAPQKFVRENDVIELDGIGLKVLFTPGHSPASICFYNEQDKWVIGGDVLFYESIGRTDLPGGDHDTLLKSIRTQLFTLPDDTAVYPGHGPKTTIGYERMFNPYLR